MPFGRGFGMGRGRGFGRGFGFRGFSPPWPYVGLGRGGLPRGWAFRAPAFFPYAPYAGHGYQWPYSPYYGTQMGYGYGFYPYW